LTTRVNYSNQCHRFQTGIFLETAVREIPGHRDNVGMSLDVQANIMIMIRRVSG
jgi:hypothetical protein